MTLNKYPTFILLLFTLVSFAANSIICRMALISYSFGAFEFTLVRLVSGILVLFPIIFVYRRNAKPANDENNTPKIGIKYSSILPPLTLFSYALFFSLAYIQLDAGMGALILFAAVQISMISISVYLGSKLNKIELMGFALAFGGLVYLLLPGLSAPALSGAVLMFISGFSWGVYSVLGKDAKHPILSTARNFLYCFPGCILLLVVIIIRTEGGWVTYSPRGILLAVLSGAVTSGLGYVLWYLTLRRITTTIASIAQLAVPLIAGFGGVLFLSEKIGIRLILASVIIFGGIVVTLLGKSRAAIKQ